MMNLRMLSMWILALAILSLGGCLDIAVKTTVDPDGSCERTISVKRQTKSLPEHGYPVPADPSWSAEWRSTNDKDQPFEYVATKRFATPEALAAEYANAPDTSALSISVSIERKFQWFYTYLDYRETYSLRNPFQRIPARTRFTPDEMNRIALGGKSDSLVRRIEEWDRRNVFEELYGRLTEEASAAGDTLLSGALMVAAKEVIFRKILEDTSGQDDRKEIDRATELLQGVLQVRDLSARRPMIARVMAEVDSMSELRKSADQWVSSVVMPGVLVSANGETVEGNEVRWTIGSKQLLVTSVFMGARSRVTNVWAFVAAGGVAVLLLVPAVLGLRRRRIRPRG